MGSTSSAVFFAFIIAGLCSCGEDNASYEKIRKLETDVIQNQIDEKSWESLLGFARGGRYWDRIYALGAIQNLAPGLNGERQSEAIDIFRKGLLDSDQIVRCACVQGIQEMGADASHASVHELVAIVRKGNEDDVTWFSAEALGEVTNPDDKQKVFEVLLEAAKKPSANPGIRGEPQLKLFALDAAEKLATGGGIEYPLQHLETLNREGDEDVRMRVKKIIARVSESPERVGP
jgi:hypothetical protein